MSLLMTQRRIIDSSGHLGSFYDIYQDLVLQESVGINNAKQKQLDESIRCEIIKGNTDKSKNLLNMIEIENNLRLNILLNTKLRTGIAALIDYPDLIDKYTRFVYISYADREQQLSDNPREVRKSSTRPAEATHIITGVTFGIDVVIVLQLPNDDNTVKCIDNILEKIQAQLKPSNNISNLTNDDKDLLEKIHKTNVYSNVFELTQMTALLQICQYIAEFKKESNSFPPLVYTLRPVEWLYPDAHESCASSTLLEKDDSDNLEHHLIKLSKTIGKLHRAFHSDKLISVIDCLPKQLQDIQNQWKTIKEDYNNVIKYFQKLISDIYSKEKDVSDLKQVLSGTEHAALRQEMKKFADDMGTLTEKGQLISNLQTENFSYHNIAEDDTFIDDNEQTSQDRLINNDEYDLILCSTDTLKKNNEEKWDALNSQLFSQRKEDPNLRLLYADFSYCKFSLSDTIILSTNKLKKENNLVHQRIQSPTIVAQTSSSSKIPPSSTENDINILLLGESGVGKSTLINAFVNYLAFKTFKQVETNKPIVLIPVSFLITTGNDFEEHIVKFGDSDSLNNENFDHVGQSVTQYCKSYVFHLNQNSGKNLRIIDTPGFGDTRGLNQDELNMQHILEYINNLTHVNAICFLLKPNASRINNFFQICLSQLLDLLGPNAQRNIIFCFTNARSTFYAPGDTAPLLKDLLKSFSMSDIPFKKKNTFCFDNESFRYLVALQNGIQFNDDEKHEYEMSWLTSVTESNRLCDYICEKLTACYIRAEHQSIKRAQLEIVHMIRPILEAMRNILRNIILLKKGSSNKLITLIPTALKHPAAICVTCKDGSIRKNEFWTVHDVPHKFQNNKCYSCSCATNHHIVIDYELDHKYLDRSSNDDNQDEMNKMLELLFHGSANFAYFLIHIARSSKDDPFWIGIVQMISEENDLCKDQNSSDTNLQLIQYLKNFKTNYEQHIDNMRPNQEYSTLSDIYTMIKRIREYPMVQVQMDKVEKTQKRIMKQYEYKVPDDLLNTSIHTTSVS